VNPKRVVFIEPAASKTNVFDNYMRLPLMGSLYLGTILHEHGCDVRILNENIIGREIDPYEISADVFCLTALTASASRTKYLAASLRRIYPDALVIIGGIHASLLPEEFAAAADHVVVGEAEDIIVDLVEGRFTEAIIQGSPVADMDALPPVKYDLMQGYEKLDIAPLMTSRGCPFDCNFCTVTKVFGRQFRNLSARRVIAEIDNALKYFSTRDFFFYDDNFTADGNRLEEICDLLIARRTDITWAAQVRADISRSPDLVAKMVRAGCRWVYIGFESIEDETLKALNKKQTRADIEQAVEVLHRFGLNIHGMFMFGEDHDTSDTFEKTVSFAIEHSIDTVQFMILTPFPGTECHRRLASEDRLLHTDWDYYNAMFAVFQPKHISAMKLQRETYNAYRRFYSLRRTLLDALSMMINILLDALVWNFRRARRHNLDNVFIRGAAKAIVIKGARESDRYMRFLDKAAKRKLLKM